MEAPLPWLRQGDIFVEVPWIVPILVNGEITAVVRSGAALLITENCQMDKRTNSGRSRIGRLQFTPLRPLADLNPDSQARLRAGDTNPPEAVYVGDIDGEEAHVYLGEAYHIPTAYFGPTVVCFNDYPAADPADPYHLVIDERWGRLGTLDQPERELLHRKMGVYWMHQLPPDEEAETPSPPAPTGD